MQEKLDRLNTVVQSTDKIALKSDLDKLTRTLVSAMKELKRHLENMAQLDRKTGDSSVSRLSKALQDLQREMTDGLTLCDEKSAQRMVDCIEMMTQEIKKLKESIPTMPDLTPIHDRIDSLSLLTIDDVEKDLPKFGERIRDGLELLQGDERLDKKAVKGIEEIEKDIKELEGKIPKVIPTGGGGRAGGMQVYDLSSQTTGSLKVFNVPKSRIGFLIGTDFPTVLMENNGYTINGTRTEITITTDNAPSSGSQLAYIYFSLFNT